MTNYICSTQKWHFQHVFKKNLYNCVVNMDDMNEMYRFRSKRIKRYSVRAFTKLQNIVV